MVMGVAIMGFGAPPTLLVIVTYSGAGPIAVTQGWIRRHPDG